MKPRLLVCRTDALGDSILTLPAVHDLRTAFPNAHITYCGRHLTQPLLEACPDIDQVLSYPEDGHHKVFYQQLFQHSFDAAIMCYPKPIALAWNLATHAVPIRVGTQRRWWGFLYNHGSRRSRSQSHLHESTLNRELAALAIQALGGDTRVCDMPAQATLVADPTEQHNIRDYISSLGIDDRYLVIQPGSRGSALDWPLERMAMVADRLRQQQVSVLFHIGPGESHIESRLHALCTLPQVCIGTGSTSHKRVIDIPQLIALLQGASCVLGNSTGPLHIAAVVGTPVVGLYPPIRNLDPDRWRPLGNQQQILLPPHTSLYASKKAAPAHIMDGISVDAVCKAISCFL